MPGFGHQRLCHQRARQTGSIETDAHARGVALVAFDLGCRQQRVAAETAEMAQRLIDALHAGQEAGGGVSVLNRYGVPGVRIRTGSSAHIHEGGSIRITTGSRRRAWNQGKGGWLSNGGCSRIDTSIGIYNYYGISSSGEAGSIGS